VPIKGTDHINRPDPWSAVPRRTHHRKETDVLKLLRGERGTPLADLEARENAANN